MVGLTLVRRKQLLTDLGLNGLAARNSWSHDLGDSIVFDAWEHRWDRNAKGQIEKYPLRTNGEHYNLARSKRNPRPGHTRWQKHVDLVVAGKRSARALMPVPNDSKANPNKGAKGWLPQVVEGHINVERNGDVWFVADRIVKL